MPDDASGNFSLVPGYLAATGSTIQPSQHNPPLEDIASAITARLPRSGVAPMTGPLKTVTGSASTPAIYPNSNPSIGIYWTATGIAFAGSVAGIRFIGELIPYTLLTAPALTVFPYGQTLLRASYPDLWALAQTDIAAGNTFYNNGNGTTTFGIGDLRGRVIAAKDDMGGTAAGRLTSAGAVTGTAMGYAGGSQLHTLTVDQMPQHGHTATTTNETSPFTLSIGGAQATVDRTDFQGVTVGGGTTLFQRPNFTSQTPSVTIPAGALSLSTTVNNAGASGTHNNVQPTIICNYLLYAGA